MICGVVVLSCTTLARAQGVPVCLEGLLTDGIARARGETVLEIENCLQLGNWKFLRIECGIERFQVLGKRAPFPLADVTCRRPRITCVARHDWRVNFASVDERCSTRRDGENLE